MSGDAGAATRFQCPNCGFVYDEARGCAHEGFLPGHRWASIADNWACPQCAVREKVDFRPLLDLEAAA